MPLTSTQRRIVLANIALCTLIVIVAVVMEVFSVRRPDLPNALLDAEPARTRRPELLNAPFDAEAARETQQRWAVYLGTEPVVTNSIGIRLQLIPPGEYNMGSPHHFR